jgi:hypothetical protein
MRGIDHQKRISRPALSECGTWGTFAGANTLAAGLNVNFSALPKTMA